MQRLGTVNLGLYPKFSEQPGKAIPIADAYDEKVVKVSLRTHRHDVVGEPAAAGRP